MQSTVNTILTSCFDDISFFFCRSDWKEGGQDASYEYGHAGKSPLSNIPISADSVRAQLRKVTCHPYLFNGAVRFVLS